MFVVVIEIMVIGVVETVISSTTSIMEWPPSLIHATATLIFVLILVDIGIRQVTLTFTSIAIAFENAKNGQHPRVMFPVSPIGDSR